MKQVGIFYGSSTGDTERIAIQIKAALGMTKASVQDILESRIEDLNQYSFLIFGVSTWGTGKIQDDWENFISQLENTDLTGKKVALFGLGDQESYPDTFSDALGILYDKLQHTGCTILGEWPVNGYEYIHSRAVRNDKFVGLVIDEKNQPEMTRERIHSWIESLGL